MLPFKLVYSPAFCVDLGPHVFPAQKYRLVAERLLRDGHARPEDFVAPEPARDADLLRVHTPDWVRKARTGALSFPELRTLEVPWSRALQEATWLCAGGALQAGRLAAHDRCAVLLGGGFHHAFPDHGEGFCLINDVAVAVQGLRASRAADRVAIVDLDVHHGNGTAAIFAEDPATFTVSLHQQDNYPLHKPASRVDVGLCDGTSDAEYLAALEGPLAEAIGFGPDILFYLAGADPYERDRLGGLALTRAGLLERDRRVLQAARGAGVPVVVCLAGGYAADPADTVAIHVGTVLAAAETFGGPASSGLQSRRMPDRKRFSANRK